jgi:DNA-binding response OmpR family regulator
MQSVLVVDDDPVVRGIWAFKLARAGFTVHEADDGETGLAAAVENHDDIVLLDWMLPNRSGIDVCREMRGRDDLNRTPVIFVSARGEECDIERAFAAGADDYLVKPVSPSELVSRVQAVLARNAVPADAPTARLLEAPQPAVIRGASGRRRLGRLRVTAAVALGLAAGVALAGNDQAGGPGVPSALRTVTPTTAVVGVGNSVLDGGRRLRWRAP